MVRHFHQQIFIIKLLAIFILTKIKEILMVRKIIAAAIVSLLMLINCGSDNIAGNDNNIESEVLIDTMVSVINQSSVISVNDGFSLMIPQGLTETSFTVNVKKPPVIDTVDEIKIINCYDIALGCGNKFNPPLTITIPYNADLVGNPDSLKAVYYDENINTWIPFESGVAQNGVFTFTTDHLTVVGLAEFITNGGYAHKFTGAKGVVVYFNLTGDDAVMNSSSYGEYGDQPYHIPTSDPLFSPIYIQDIAFALKDAREKFASTPNSLQAPDSNEVIEVYVKDLDGSDGQFGTISGALYINNTVTAPTKPSGISNRQVLQSTVVHEYLHFLQDYYYVVNNASIGLWWLEAIATQADRMIWGGKYTYSESEIYSIESNAALIDNLSRSWDDCSSDPNWYLAGCFLNYLSWHRDVTKLNVASILKAGGSSNSIYRIVLNNEINTQLSSDIGKEFTDYVRYLFEEGNENLTALTDGIAFIETNQSFNVTIQRNKNSTREEGKVGVPYLAAKMITLKNSDTDTLKTKINKVSALNSDIYLCKYDDLNEKFTGFVPVTDDGVISILPQKNDKEYILVINSSFTSSDTVKLAMSKADDAKIDVFQFMSVTFEGSNDNTIQYSNSSGDCNFKIGFLSDQTDAYKSIESVFKTNGTFSVIADNVTGVAASGGLDEEASSYDSSRLKIWGKYDGNILYDVEISQNRLVISPDDEWITNKDGRDTLVTTYFNENCSLKIDTIVLDQSSQYFTYFKVWNGSKIQSHVAKIEHDFVKYAEVNGVVDTIMPFSKKVSIDWGSMVTMTMLCGKK